MRTRLKFTCGNEIEEMDEGPLVHVKVEPGSTFTCTRDSIHCLHLIYVLTRVKITRQWKSTLRESWPSGSLKNPNDASIRLTLPKIGDRELSSAFLESFFLGGHLPILVYKSSLPWVDCVWRIQRTPFRR